MQHPPKTNRERRPRTRLCLVLLGAGIALAVTALILLPAIKARHPSRTGAVSLRESTVRTLYLGDPSALDRVTISQLDGDSYTLRMRDGRLQLERGGEWFSVSEASERDLIKAVTQLVVQDTVAGDAAEVAGHLADMGLEPPQATALIRYRDGTEISLEVGYGVPNTSYSYYRWSGDNGVYMCDSGVADTLFTTAGRLLPVTQPTVVKPLIDKVTLVTRDGQIDISFSMDNAGYISGMLTAPYAYPLDPDQTDALLTALSSFRLGTREAEATPAARKSYGLDDPLMTVWLHQKGGFMNVIGEDGQLAVSAVDEQTFRFVVGRTEGDYFYTCEYAGGCYLVSRFLLETLLGVTPDKLAARRPADLGGAALADIRIEAPQGALHVSAAYTERVLPNNAIETDEHGNAVYDIAVTLNGAKAEAEVLTALTSRLNALTVSGDLPSGWTIPEAARPRWRIVLTTAGGARREIAAYRMDAFSDALAVDGVARHYSHEEAIDLVLADLLE